jgi:nucleoside-diphosphate-sugar epimerase
VNRDNGGNDGESNAMRVCVTGGTGFLGGALVRRLLAEHAPVRVLARPSRRADELEARGAEVVRGELGDPEAVARAVRGTELVYHVAAKVDPAGTVAEFFETNVGGTERVLTACHEQGIRRVIYESSIAVYGLVKGGEHIDENTQYDEFPKLRDFYSQSKLAADQLAVSFARKTGLPLVIMRPGIIYGPGKPLPLGLLAFNLGKGNFVFGSPDLHFPLNYVGNLIDAMQLAANLEGEQLCEFNIVDDEELTLGRYHDTKSNVDHTRTRYFPGWPVLLAAPIAEAVMRVLPLGGTRLSKHQLKRSLQDRFYDTRRIRQETGWTPNVPLEESIRRTLGTPEHG